MAASGVFASHEKSSPHFLAAYIIFYFFLNVNMISKSPIQRTPDRNLFPYAMTYFNFFTNNSCFLSSFCYNLCYNVNRRVMVKYHDSIYARKSWSAASFGPVFAPLTRRRLRLYPKEEHRELMDYAVLKKELWKPSFSYIIFRDKGGSCRLSE